jgi:hypothetical protein
MTADTTPESLSVHRSLDEIRKELQSDGFREIPVGPRDPALRVGARVRNAGEQFNRAYQQGTATVIAVMRRGTDENPDSWERSWGRPNVEVIVDRGVDRRDLTVPRYTNWADYGTALAAEQIGEN